MTPRTIYVGVMRFTPAVFEFEEPGGRLAPFDVPVPDARIISDELFNKVAVLEKKTPLTIDPRPTLLHKRVICPACGAPMTCPKTNRTKVIYCTAKHDTPQRYYDTARLEGAVFQAVEEILTSQFFSHAFSSKLNSERENIRDEHESARMRFEASIAGLEEKLKRGRHNILFMNGQNHEEAIKDLDELRMKIAELVKSRDEQKAASDLVSRYIVVDRGEADLMLSFIKTIAAQLPFRPDSAEASQVFFIFREMISAVRVTNNTVGSQDVSVTFNLTRADRGVASIERVVTVKDLNVLRGQTYPAARAEHLRTRILSCGVQTSQEEFETLPPIALLERHSESSKAITDAVLVAAALKQSVFAVGREMGLSAAQSHRALRLTDSSQFDDIVHHLKKFRGPLVDLVRPKKRSSHSGRSRLEKAFHPMLLLRMCHPGADKAQLNDVQWDAIKNLFPPRYWNRDRVRIELDQYFHFIRSDLSAADFFDLTGVVVEPRMRFSFKPSLEREVFRRLLEIDGYAMPLGYKMPKVQGQSFKTSLTSEAVRNRIASYFKPVDRSADPGPVMKSFGDLILNFCKRVAEAVRADNSTA